MPSPDARLRDTARALGRASVRKAVRDWLVPIEYSRVREIPTLLALSGLEARRDEPLRILDVGSPQLVSLTLARMSPRWQIVYANPFPPERHEMDRARSSLGLENPEVVDLDLRDAAQVDALGGGFDLVISCSVFEHIHPEAGGDGRAAANLPRLLGPGGQVVLSVPYHREAFCEYREGGVYADQSGVAGRVFFQRFYDEAGIATGLVEPSGMRRAETWYVGETGYRPQDIHDRLARRLGGPLARVVLGRLYPWIARRHLSPPTTDPASLAKPYLAFVRLCS